MICNFKPYGQSLLKISNDRRFLQTQKEQHIEIYEQNTNAALNKYDKRVTDQPNDIKQIEIVSYWYNTKVLRIFDQLTIYFTLPLHIQYQKFNKEITNPLQSNKAIAVMDASVKN